MTGRYSRVHAEIDLDAVLYNMESMHRNISRNTKIMAVIKADGYGHGAVQIAKTIDKLAYLYGYGVATAEEALQLRRHGFMKPILILGYVFPEWYEELIQNEIRPAVFTYETAEALERAAARQNKMCTIHFAIDTGMSRIGYQADEKSADEMARIGKMKHIIVEGIFTHFARADEADKTCTYEQLARFRDMRTLLQKRGVQIPVWHCSNSAGIMEIPEANMDVVRAGITLYGLWPSDQVDRTKLSIRPVMSLKSHISYIKELPKGRSVSYGGTYTAESKRRIATIPAGYADGYARSLSGRGEVLIRGRRAPILGRICMDQFMADVTEIPDAAVHDEVILIGGDDREQITMEEAGERSGRFNYEFACGIGKRVPRVYVKEGVRICENNGSFF